MSKQEVIADCSTGYFSQNRLSFTASTFARLNNLEYIHMRGKMNSYRFEISNRRDNKFCSHDISFRLRFKTTRYFDGHMWVFHFG